MKQLQALGDQDGLRGLHGLFSRNPIPQGITVHPGTEPELWLPTPGRDEGMSPPGCLIAIAAAMTAAFTKGGSDSAMCFAAFCEFTSGECLEQKTNTMSP